MQVRFTVERGRALPEVGEPCRYFQHIDGTLITDDGEKIGRITAYRILFGLMVNEGESWAEICDAESQEAHDIQFSICSDTDDYEFREFIDGTSGSDVLVVQSAEIIERYRGKGLGLAMVQETLEMFEFGCAVTVVEPHPIRKSGGDDDVAWEKAMQRDKLACDAAAYQVGAKKLRKYWEKLGFKPVPGSKKRFYFRDPGYRHPSPGPAALMSVEEGDAADA